MRHDWTTDTMAQCTCTRQWGVVGGLAYTCCKHKMHDCVVRLSERRKQKFWDGFLCFELICHQQLPRSLIIDMSLIIAPTDKQADGHFTHWACVQGNRNKREEGVVNYYILCVLPGLQINPHFTDIKGFSWTRERHKQNQLFYYSGVCMYIIVIHVIVLLWSLHDFENLDNS